MTPRSHLGDFPLATGHHEPLQNRIQNQKWLRAQTTLQYNDVDIAANSLALLQTWQNIPDIVLSIDTSIRQQLLPIATYKKYKLHQQVEEMKCRICGQKQETVFHIMCLCSTIAQSLHTSWHDKMLRSFYHYLLHLYDFENDHSKPWYERQPPSAVIANDKANVEQCILSPRTSRRR